MANEMHGEGNGGHASSAGDPKSAIEPHGGEPDEHRIRQRAHEIWTEEGKPDGRDKEHWLRARWELAHE